jgi:hypothetical protein
VTPEQARNVQQAAALVSASARHDSQGLDVLLFDHLDDPSPSSEAIDVLDSLVPLAVMTGQHAGRVS